MTIGVPIVACLHRVRRIHNAAQTPLPCGTSITCAWAVATATARRPWAGLTLCVYVDVYMRLAAVLCRMLLHSFLPNEDVCSWSSLSTTVIKFSIDIIMKAILFVILNVSVCFPRGSVVVEILIPEGVWGVERQKFSRLAIARHDPPTTQPLIFTLATT